MAPERSSSPAAPGVRRLARLIAGLALVAVIAACGSGDQPELRAVHHHAERTPTATLAPKPSASASIAQSDVPHAPSESPARSVAGLYTLQIPRIGVNAPVVAIKSNADRVLVPPRNPGLAGWWSDGAAPGQPRGSVVVVGHTVRAGGGVFDHIGTLHHGDTIQVEGSHATLAYRVQSVAVLSKDDLAREAEKIFTQTGPGRLVVITCADWDGSSWRSNIVTIATPA